ncbi:MAG: lytic transglycosylase, partial [Candidatus Limnocylindria bacterium]
MHRPRRIAPIVALAAAVLVAPTFAAVALAADPTVVVKRGDTLTRIAREQGVTIATLVELNQLPDPNRIYPGQQLRIGTDEGAADPPPAPAAAAAEPQVHVVARGENLTRIARHYGVTVAAIVAANAIANPRLIFAGQRLVVPGVAVATAVAAAAATPAPAPVSAAQIHVVVRGETVSGIALRYGVTVADIVGANAIANPSRILASQRLAIPGARAPAAQVAVASGMPASMAARVADRAVVRQVITEEANRYGVPVAFALAVAWQESGWQQEVVSHAGAVGVMQLMPDTAEWVGEAMLGHPVQINDTRHNIRAGVRLLAYYLDRYAGDRNRVLAAYYQGQAAVDRHGIYPVSVPYIGSISTLE